MSVLLMLRLPRDYGDWKKYPLCLELNISIESVKTRSPVRSMRVCFDMALPCLAGNLTDPTGGPDSSSLPRSRERKEAFATNEQLYCVYRTGMNRHPLESGSQAVRITLSIGFLF